MGKPVRILVWDADGCGHVVPARRCSWKADQSRDINIVSIPEFAVTL